MKVAYLPIFVRQYKKLPELLQGDIDEKIALFRRNPANQFLKTHKLKGIFKNCFSFSVNYQYRIIFKYLSKDEVVLLTVGNHGIYN